MAQRSKLLGAPSRKAILGTARVLTHLQFAPCHKNTDTPSGQARGISGLHLQIRRIYVLEELSGQIAYTAEEVFDCVDDILKECNKIVDDILKGIVAVTFGEVTKVAEDIIYAA